jgi:hypothetical protein
LAIQTTARFYKIDITPGNTKIAAAIAYTGAHGEVWGEVARRIAPWRQTHEHPAL